MKYLIVLIILISSAFAQNNPRISSCTGLGFTIGEIDKAFGPITLNKHIWGKQKAKFFKATENEEVYVYPVFGANAHITYYFKKGKNGKCIRLVIKPGDPGKYKSWAIEDWRRKKVLADNAELIGRKNITVADAGVFIILYLKGHEPKK